jgi:hypothetical protein
MQAINLKPFINAEFNASTFESFVHFFLINMTTTLAESGKHGDIQDVINIAFSGDKAEKAEVVLTINGVEFPFLAAMKRLYEQWGYIVKKEAASMVREEFGDKTGPIYELLDELQRKLETHLGIEEGER